jgi:RimJ/RimL family protein N-acetyltransferase
MSANDQDPTSNTVRLRDVALDDIATLYEHQLDPESNRMAAVFPRDEAAFRAKWTTILDDETVVPRAILLDDALVGSISCFKLDGRDAIGYWIAKDHWGRGIATRALALLLEEVKTRPLYARVATHNVGSIRVLERNGFVITGYQHSPATERYAECEEAILELD